MKVDFHVHTKYSRDSLTTLEVLKKICDKKGLFPVITDHGTIKGALMFRKKFGECIVGEEIKTLHGEVIGLYLGEEIPQGLSIHETIDRIRQQGGIVYLPHPFDKLRSCLTRFDFKADIVEVYNSRVLIGRYNGMAEKFAEKRNLLKASGSDAHMARRIGTCYAELEDFSSRKELLRNLRKAKLVKKKTPLYDLAWTEAVNYCKKLRS
jgi:predicted metal-dependent phosphoesterase TrpH